MIATLLKGRMKKMHQKYQHILVNLQTAICIEFHKLIAKKLVKRLDKNTEKRFISPA